ncbi:hypothetical protein AHF37_11756 [Paragonimus kellicotti]|nr:hypothetical protein AHF37_11756 [Paragonimus kellicotti]
MDEKTPLISAGESRVEPVHSGNVVAHAETNYIDNQATINCHVCNHVVSIENREKQLVVRCPNCSEATYAAQKQLESDALDLNAKRLSFYMRMTPPYVTTIYPGRILQVSRLAPLKAYGLLVATAILPFSVAGNPSASGSQHSALISCLSGGTSAGAAGLIAARCPHCRKVTSVGPAYARVRLVVYTLLTIVALIIAIGVTVGTVNAATSNKALYFLWTEGD